jgi:hypothetical protein
MITRNTKCCLIALSVAMCVYGASTVGIAQVEVPETEKAFLRFEINLEKARQSKTFSSLLDDRQLSTMELVPTSVDLRFSDVKRIQGAIAPGVIELMFMGVDQQSSRKVDRDAEAESNSEDNQQSEYSQQEVNQHYLSNELTGNSPGDLLGNSLGEALGGGRIQGNSRHVSRQDSDPETDQEEIILPLFASIEFASPEAMNRVLTALERGFAAVEVKGVKVLRPQDGPKSFCIRVANEQTIEFGWDQFVLGEERDFGTVELKERWKETEGATFRVAIDYLPIKPIIARVMTMEGSEDLIQPVQFLKDMQSAAIAVDLQSENLVSVDAVFVDARAAESVSNKCNEHLSQFSEMFNAEIANEIPLEQKELETIRSSVSSLKTIAKGNRVSFSVANPEGFDALVTSVNKHMQIESEAAIKSNNFRQVGLAIHNYESVYAELPFPTPNKSISPELSWRVAILPYAEQTALFNKFNTDQPWDSETNKPLLKSMPQIFGSNQPNTNVSWVKSADQDRITFAHIKDGTANTIMLIENPQGIQWTQPQDLTAEEAVKLVAELAEGQSLLVVYYDGHVQRISNKTDRDTLKALMTIDGAEVIDYEKIK